MSTNDVQATSVMRKLDSRKKAGGKGQFEKKVQEEEQEVRREMFTRLGFQPLGSRHWLDVYLSPLYFLCMFTSKLQKPKLLYQLI